MLRVGNIQGSALRAVKSQRTYLSIRSRLGGVASFHYSAQLKNKFSGDKQREEIVERQLKKNPNFNHELGSNSHGYDHGHDHGHDHVHLRMSETEKNDNMTLGSMAHRRAQHNTAHHHSHSRATLNPMLVLNMEQMKNNPGVRITWIGLAINVGLALGKFTGGVVFHSQALMADSVHAVSDMVSDFLTLFSVSLANNKSSKDYPFGFGKIETVGSLAVSTILATAGLSIGWSSLCAIVGPIIPHSILETLQYFMGHGHSHGVTKGVTDVNAAWIAAGSIAVKEWIFQATKRVAIASNSNVLMSNAWHHRVDSLTSLVALVTITGGHFFNIQSLDSFGGLIVSALVIKAGGEGMISAVKELCDKSLPTHDERYLEVKLALQESLSKMLSNNNSGRPYGIKHLTVLPSGPNLTAIATLEVPLQRWGNVLGIKEFEVISDHLRCVLYKNLPHLKNLIIEYVEEEQELSQEDLDTMAKPNTEVPELEHKSSGFRQGHTHSHFGSGTSHTHNH